MQKQMAHVVGVPKREPCQKCGNPIFLAERLTVGKALYHRTCLRCARCESQLTLGSFYETEIDGEFCCETCPDEEKKIQINDRLGVGNSDEVDNTNTNFIGDQTRKSFSEKLAMFQTNGKGLLQKSLSDEEKSKSLKRLSEMIANNSPGQEDEPTKLCTETVSNANGNDKDIDSDTSTSDSDDEVPPLPTTQPPSLDSDTENVTPTVAATKPPTPSKINVLNKIYGTKVNSPTKLLPSGQSSSANESHQFDQNNLFKMPSPAIDIINTKPSQIDINRSNLETLDSNSENVDKNIVPPTNDAYVFAVNTINNNELMIKSNIENNNLNINNMPSDALNSFTNVTKEDKNIIERSDDENDCDQTIDNHKCNNENADNVNDTNDSEDASNKGIELRQKQSISRNSNSKNSTNEINLIDNDKNNSINSCNRNSNVVRSRLSQFEALLQTEPKRSPKHSNHNALDIVNNSKPTQQTIDTVHEIAVSATETADHMHMSHVNNLAEINVPTTDQLLEINNTINENGENIIINNHKTMENEKEPNAESSKEIIKPVPVKRITKDIQLTDNLQLPPTPLKRKNRSATRAEEDDKKSIDSTETSTEHIQATEANEIKENTCEKTVENESLVATKNYPISLNPFGSDDDNDPDESAIAIRKNETKLSKKSSKTDALNPFDSSDDEIELLKDKTPKKVSIKQSSKYRISTNPFGSEPEDDEEIDSISSKRTPVPTPRKPLNGSIQSTPEPSPRMSRTLNPKMRISMKPGDDYYGSNASLASSNYRSYDGLTRNGLVHGSMSSLASTPRHKKGRAPAVPQYGNELSPFRQSTNSSPSHSNRATPLSKKKRPAPAPPKANESVTSMLYLTANSQMDDSVSGRSNLDDSLTSTMENSSINLDTSIESTYASTTHPSDESDFFTAHRINDDSIESIQPAEESQRKLIPIDASLLEDYPLTSLNETPIETDVVYRRTIVPFKIDSTPPNDRQWEKMKENKESQNKNRQSQILLSPATIESDALYGANKSSYGKWKRRKGPAPSLPIPPKKVLQMLPLQEIRYELEVIEVQQQGLEKQGVMLEKMIRERCEGTEHENTPVDEFKPNSKEVEDLILQLFELVNEKNELFRRQAELMYLRRQHRLEQEQADIEYEIRVLMAQPECNKTDSDKSREETLISRLVEVVQLRNNVIESLEMDRLREAEEDQSIKERLELHTAKRDEQLSQQTPTKLSKKEKKKQKESKKLAKQKKVDADKDADESEISQEKVKEKKKKKKFLF